MTHHDLCLKAAIWLRTKNKGFRLPTCRWVGIEVASVGQACIADVFGWGDGIGIGWAGVQIECKMSHSDFLADKKKASATDSSLDVGYIKYYCCPEGIIQPDELPKDFGLLWLAEDGMKVMVVGRERADKQPAREVPLIASVMRQIGIKDGIFDFKNKTL